MSTSWWKKSRWGVWGGAESIERRGWERAGGRAVERGIGCWNFAEEIGLVPIPIRKEQNGYIVNSLIVSGQNALDIRGSALITVSNSIIVGEGNAIRSDGATMVIARGSVFHGPRAITGAFAFVDLGGNTIE